MRIQPGFEFVDQAAFSQTRLTLDNDHSHAAIRHTLCECVLYDLEFRSAADHSSCYSFDAAPANPKGARSHALNDVSLQGFPLAFDGHRRLNLYIEHAAYKLIGIMGNEDLTWLCRCPETAGRVDCITHRRKFT